MTRAGHTHAKHQLGGLATPDGWWNGDLDPCLHGLTGAHVVHLPDMMVPNPCMQVDAVRRQQQWPQTAWTTASRWVEYAVHLLGEHAEVEHTGSEEEEALHD